MPQAPTDSNQLSRELSDAVAHYTKRRSREKGCSERYEQLLSFAEKALKRHGIVCMESLRSVDDEAWSRTGLPLDMKSELLNDPFAHIGPVTRENYKPIDELFWSHDKIYDHFSDDRSVYETVCDLLKATDAKEHDVYVDLLPALQVVDFDGRMYSLSNRRLFALRDFQHILTNLVGPRRVWAPVEFVELQHGGPFTTKCNGEWVSLSRPVRIVFERHEHGPRILSPERVRSLSRGRSQSLPRGQRSLSRTKTKESGHESKSIAMPEIAEDDLENEACRTQSPSSEEVGLNSRERPNRDRAQFNASRRGRSSDRYVHDDNEPWWIGVARQPQVSEERLQEFASQWNFQRRTVDMLRRLQPGLLYYVIRDFAPPTNYAGAYRFGYDGILNKFVTNAQWKLEHEANKRRT